LFFVEPGININTTTTHCTRHISTERATS